MADPTSNGEIAAYRAGRAIRRVVNVRPSTKAFAALIALGIILPAILGIAWISARIDVAGFEVTSSTVGPFTVDASGYTVINPVDTTSGTCGGPTATADGTCIYYVANDGTDDATNCKGYPPPVTSTPTTKCATLSFAMQRIRPGKPDWVLFKRGQTFTVSSLVVYGNNLGASDSSHPFVMSAYPRDPVSFDDRPIIDCLRRQCLQTQAGYGSFAFISLRFTDSAMNPNSANYWTVRNDPNDVGIKLLSTPRYFTLFEDNEFTYGLFATDIASGEVSSGPIYYRRNVFWNDGPPGLAALSGGVSASALVVEENLIYKDWTSRNNAASSVTITAATPAVITYAANSATPPESGGLPPFGVFGAPPLIGLQGTLPTGLTAISTNCNNSNQCYYLCNISGATANLSRSSSCTPLINTSGAPCNSGCSSRWSDNNANIYSHNIYLGTGWEGAAKITSNNVVIRNNITAYASATGTQVRSGGTYYNNLYLKNPIQANGFSWPSEMSYNVVLQAGNMNTAVNTQAYGWGFTISNYQCGTPAYNICTQNLINSPPNPGTSGSRIHHNILAKSEAPQGNAIAISLGAAQFYNDNDCCYIGATTGITLDNNIVCDWPTLANKPYDDQGIGNTLASSNKPTSNTDATCASLGLTPATVADYYTNVLGGAGGSTTDDFLSAALAKWTKISWDERYGAARVNDYIRQSYGMTNPTNQRRVRLNAVP